MKWLVAYEKVNVKNKHHAHDTITTLAKPLRKSRWFFIFDNNYYTTKHPLLSRCSFKKIYLLTRHRLRYTINRNHRNLSVQFLLNNLHHILMHIR